MVALTAQIPAGARPGPVTGSTAPAIRLSLTEVVVRRVFYRIFVALRAVRAPSHVVSSMLNAVCLVLPVGAVGKIFNPVIGRVSIQMSNLKGRWAKKCFCNKTMDKDGAIWVSYPFVPFRVGKLFKNPPFNGQGPSVSAGSYAVYSSNSSLATDLQVWRTGNRQPSFCHSTYTNIRGASNA